MLQLRLMGNVVLRAVHQTLNGVDNINLSDGDIRRVCVFLMKWCCSDVRGSVVEHTAGFYLLLM